MAVRACVKYAVAHKTSSLLEAFQCSRFVEYELFYTNLGTTRALPTDCHLQVLRDSSSRTTYHYSHLLREDRHPDFFKRFVASHDVYQYGSA